MNLRKSALTPVAPTSPDSSALSVAVSGAQDRVPDEPSLPAGGEAVSSFEVLDPVGLAPVQVSLSSGDQGLTYRPTEAQQRVKARFWSRWVDDASGREPSLALVSQLTASAAVREWWSKPGFRDWFMCTSVTEERLSYLLNLALSSAEDILLNTSEKAQSARVQMIKVVAEMSGKLRQASAGGANPDSKKLTQVAKMDKDELVKLLQDSGFRIERVLNLPTPKE